jgi:hypothetical protein
MKIINNIMHINHSGANINILCGGPNEDKQQNNFIFNHTAPINLNFYEEVKKKSENRNNALKVNTSSGEAEIEVKPDEEEATEVLTKSPNKKIA